MVKMWLKNHLFFIHSCNFGLFRPQILILGTDVPDATVSAVFLLFSVRLGARSDFL